MVEQFVDVSDQVEFGANDDECLPLHTCVCGAKFAAWTQVLSIYPETPWTCPQCGRRLHFSFSIQVYAEAA